MIQFKCAVLRVRNSHCEYLVSFEYQDRLYLIEDLKHFVNWNTDRTLV